MLALVTAAPCGGWRFWSTHQHLGWATDLLSKPSVEPARGARQARQRPHDGRPVVALVLRWPPLHVCDDVLQQLSRVVPQSSARLCNAGDALQCMPRSAKRAVPNSSACLCDACNPLQNVQQNEDVTALWTWPIDNCMSSLGCSMCSQAKHIPSAITSMIHQPPWLTQSC